MGRPRKYATDAERQRACRERQEASTVRVDRRAWERLHLRLDQLQEALWQAARAGDERARASYAGHQETMLEKLIEAFRSRAAAAEARVSEPSEKGKGGRTKGALKPR
jgi:hypothetical protein